MNRRTFLKTVPAFTMLAGTASSFAKDLQPITLLKPQTDGGKSVLAALWERKTNRNISDQQLPAQVLSNLFWAAFGINRETTSFRKPGRTAPSASNSQEIDLYVATGLIAQNVYLFAASCGLAAWFHNCDKRNTAKELKLRSEQRVLFAQTVGYPV